MNTQDVVDPQLECSGQREIVHWRGNQQDIATFQLADQRFGDLESRCVERRGRRQAPGVIHAERWQWVCAQVAFDQFEPRMALAKGVHQFQCQLVRMGNLAIGAGVDQ